MLVGKKKILVGKKFLVGKHFWSEFFFGRKQFLVGIFFGRLKTIPPIPSKPEVFWFWMRMHPYTYLSLSAHMPSVSVGFRVVNTTSTSHTHPNPICHARLKAAERMIDQQYMFWKTAPKLKYFYLQRLTFHYLNLTTNQQDLGCLCRLSSS